MSKLTTHPYILYSDGSSSPHTDKKPGGWGFLLIDPLKRCVAYGKGARWNITNNIMEIQAAIYGLQLCRSDVTLLKNINLFGIYLVSDSQYTLQTADGSSHISKNVDICNKLRKLYSATNAMCRWVKGHQVKIQKRPKDPPVVYSQDALGNHRADVLAGSAKQKLIDTGIEFKEIVAVPELYQKLVLNEEGIPCPQSLRPPRLIKYRMEPQSLNLCG